MKYNHPNSNGSFKIVKIKTNEEYVGNNILVIM